jgi:hypothetical protein
MVARRRHQTEPLHECDGIPVFLFAVVRMEQWVKMAVLLVVILSLRSTRSTDVSSMAIVLSNSGFSVTLVFL